MAIHPHYVEDLLSAIKDFFAAEGKAVPEDRLEVLKGDLTSLKDARKYWSSFPPVKVRFLMNQMKREIAKLPKKDQDKLNAILEPTKH
jgi:hypothetical protein